MDMKYQLSNSKVADSLQHECEVVTDISDNGDAVSVTIHDVLKSKQKPMNILEKILNRWKRRPRASYHPDTDTVYVNLKPGKPSSDCKTERKKVTVDVDRRGRTVAVTIHDVGKKK